MKLLVLVAVIAINIIEIYSSDQPPLKATTIHEPPYIVEVKKANSTNIEDYTGYIPDFLQKLSSRINRKFSIHLVADKKYGRKINNNEWSGMIGEVIKGSADIAAAPMTVSDERKQAIDFTDSFMTFDTLVILKKGYPSSKVRSAAELHNNNTDIKVGVVDDGFTQNFFKNTNQEIYKEMYKRMEKDKLPSTSSEGVAKVRSGEGKYAFVIEAATADYWMNSQPCDIVSFRLGSALPFHEYSFAFKKNAPFKGELDRAIEDMKSKGEHDMLRAKWWPTQCSGASFNVPSTWLSSLLALLTAAVAAAVRVHQL